MGEGRTPSLDLMRQPSCKRQRETVTYLTLSPSGRALMVFSLPIPDRVSISGWSLNPQGRDATVTGAD